MKTRAVAFLLVWSSIAVVAGDYEGKIEKLFTTQKGEQYPAETYAGVLPFSVGQWVMYGNTDDDDERSISRNSIIARDGEVWTLEMYVMTDDNITITQFDVVGMDKAMQTGTVDDVVFKRIRVKVNDADPMEISGFILDMSKGLYKEALKSWVTTTTSSVSDGGALTVPAGTFAGTTKVRSSITVMGKTIEADCYMSGVVPLGGVVQSRNSDGYSQILLDFGLSGAKASY